MESTIMTPILKWGNPTSLRLAAKPRSEHRLTLESTVIRTNPDCGDKLPTRCSASTSYPKHLSSLSHLQGTHAHFRGQFNRHLFSKAFRGAPAQHNSHRVSVAHKNSYGDGEQWWQQNQVNVLKIPSCTLKNGEDSKFLLCAFHHNYNYR